MRSSILLGSVIGLLLLASCERECDWTGTDIRVYQEWGEERLYLDTFVAPEYIYFETGEEVDSVVWQIGDDPQVRNGNPLELRFDEGFEDGIEVRATAYGGCLDGEASQQSKTIWVLPKEKSPLVGKYVAYDTQTPEDTFEIEIFFWKEWLLMDNFPQLCDSVQPLLASFDHSYSFGFAVIKNKSGEISIYQDEGEDADRFFNPFPTPHTGCYIEQVYRSFGILQEDRKTLTIDYQFGTTEGAVEQRQVIATKIK